MPPVKLTVYSTTAFTFVVHLQLYFNNPVSWIQALRGLLRSIELKIQAGWLGIQSAPCRNLWMAKVAYGFILSLRLLLVKGSKVPCCRCGEFGITAVDMLLLRILSVSRKPQPKAGDGERAALCVLFSPSLLSCTVVSTTSLEMVPIQHLQWTLYSSVRTCPSWYSLQLSLSPGFLSSFPLSSSFSSTTRFLLRPLLRLFRFLCLFLLILLVSLFLVFPFKSHLEKKVQ